MNSTEDLQKMMIFCPRKTFLSDMYDDNKCKAENTGE
jgi:hypothetical protein